MTDHLSSSPALAASKPVKFFFFFPPFFPQKKEKSKRRKIFYLCFGVFLFCFFLSLKDRKGEGKMLFSSKDPYQQVCPVGLLGAGGFFKAVFFDNRAAPKPLLTSESISGSTAFRDARQDEEEGGVEREEGICENDFSPSLTASGRIFFHRQQELSSHTVLLFTGVRAGDLKSHLTQEEQRNMVHFQQFRESWVIGGPLFCTFAAGARCSALLTEFSLPPVMTQIHGISVAFIPLSNVCSVLLYWNSC